MTVPVQTVLGEIKSDQLGLTLVHEHIINDVRASWHQPDAGDAQGQQVANAPVTIETLGRLRNDPLLSLDNMTLLDESTAVDELLLLRHAGGQTICSQSSRRLRDPLGLQRISRATGLNLIMGTGYYMEKSHPPELRAMSAANICDQFTQDLLSGCDGTTIRAGLISEIGISKDFTTEEEKVLRGAAQAQMRTRVPLFVHLPGWHRLGGRVLDVVAEEGGDLNATVLCHMNPSLDDTAYQTGLADRGAWIAYDMIGMDFYYADQAAQSPSDEENARAISALVRSGYGHRLLLSSDVFLKMMLVRYGGLGYAHVLTTFAARLRRHGILPTEIDDLLIGNPRHMFELAAADATAG